MMETSADFASSATSGATSGATPAAATSAATAAVAAKPWALCWSSDASTGADALYTTHLLGPGVTAIDPSTLCVRA